MGRFSDCGGWVVFSDLFFPESNEISKWVVLVIAGVGRF